MSPGYECLWMAAQSRARRDHGQGVTRVRIGIPRHLLFTGGAGKAGRSARIRTLLTPGIV
jgi:hypothetical protein